MGVNLDRTYEVIDKLNRAVTSQGISDALTSFTGRYGLTCMIAGALPSLKERVQEQHLLVSAYPAGWMDRYLDQDYARIDPIISRIMRDPSPFPWSEDVTLAESKHCALAKRMFDEAAEFDLRVGFVVPLITLDGAVAAVSLGGGAVDSRQRPGE